MSSSQTPRKPLHVSVTITLDVDPDAWNTHYGEGDTAAEVRQSVKAYIGNDLQRSIHADSGTWTNIDWK